MYIKGLTELSGYSYSCKLLVALHFFRALTMTISHDHPTAVEPDFVQGFDMQEYREKVPLWKRIWQHSLTQMMLLSVQAFCGPAMSDAITGKDQN